MVITGLSGSGKSSLAFDTIFAEGQRRYVESLSAYARQFLGQMDKPDVDYIEGLSPAVSIDQKGASHNPRSTVGTVTEIYDYLRLLFSRAGIPHCPVCGREVTRQSAQEIVEALEKLEDDSRILVLAPLVRGRKGTHGAILDEIRKAGFVRARVDGVVHELDEDIQMDRYKNHTIEAVVDRLIIRHHESEDEAETARSRLTNSVETALKFGDGYLTIQVLNPSENLQEALNLAPGASLTTENEDSAHDLLYSEHLSCPEHGVSLTEIEPRTFSFNTPHGACPECQGLGGKLEVDPSMLIPDGELALNEGAIIMNEWSGPREEGGYYWQLLEAVAREYHIDLSEPVCAIPAEKMNVILYGTRGKDVTVHYQNKDGRKSTFQTPFEGVINNLHRRYQESSSDYFREKVSEVMSERICQSCNGARLRKEAMAVTVDDTNIVEVTSWPVVKSLEWANRLAAEDTPLNDRQQVIAERILKEIQSRLGFLVDVGLDYLTLQRSAASLSGGEAQRIRLATQIGSRLMGVLYVLDEPSIGLHPRDNTRLLTTLKGLRDLGNTVLVVEHDAETILSADWVVDLGPLAGELGGRVIANGTIDEIIDHPEIADRSLSFWKTEGSHSRYTPVREWKLAACGGRQRE